MPSRHFRPFRQRLPPNYARCWCSNCCRQPPNARFDLFSRSLYRYGHVAGSCFAAGQAGQFAGPHSLPLIETLRSWGIEGVGQSSWGPTVFAVMADERQAQDAARRLQCQWHELLECVVAAPTTQGAQIISEL